MKKTIIALLAMAGVASAATTVELEGEVTLSEITIATGDSIKFKDGLTFLIDKDVSVVNVDPVDNEVIKNVTLNFTSTSTLTATHHFAITTTANKASLESVNYGFIVTDAEYDSFISTLNTEGSVTHTLINPTNGNGGTWEMDSAWKQGVVSLTLSQNLIDLGYTVKVGNVSGLDDLKAGEFGIGQAAWDKPIIVYGKAIPEPTTATLSLLALAGLAARRRRR